MTARLPSSTRPVSPALTAMLQSLKAGQKIRITQTVRVGMQVWTTTVTGVFRDLNYLSTGLSANRVPEDAIVVATVHFAKENGEFSSITLDEHSKIEVA
jgi:hypothetical protein